MKPFLMALCCVLTLICLQGCDGSKAKSESTNSAQKQTPSAKIPVPKANGNLAIRNKEDLVGYWIGMFRPAILDDRGMNYWFKINISIDSVNGDKIMGHTVMAGVVNKFTGSVKADGGAFLLSASQLGDGKFDGVFNASIAVGDTAIKGNWEPNHVIGNVKECSYKLEKKLFHYNATAALANEPEEDRYVGARKNPGKKLADNESPEFAVSTEDVFKYNPSVQLLTKDDVVNLKKADLLVLRNSIFARHGYAFKKRDLRSFLEAADWYMPVSTDVTGQLTDIEKKNIGLLSRYEKNAKEFYMSFSR